MIAAEIDCSTTPLNGRQRGIIPAGFTLVFLTEPVGNNGGNGNNLRFDIWGEVLGNAKFGFGGASDAGGRIRDVVRLYR